MEQNEQQLIAAYLNGQPKALEMLIKRYLNSIYNFIYRLVNNPTDAEDLTQEVFVRLWQNLQKFDPNKNFKSWLFTIAHNIVIDFFRKKKDLPFSTFNNDGQEENIIEKIADPAPLPPEIWEKQNLAEEIRQILNILKPQDRMIIILHNDENLSFQEISIITRQPLNTIKSRYRRILIKLRVLLTE